MKLDIDVESKGNHLIETPNRNYVTTYEGASVTLSCQVVYQREDFKYFEWVIGREDFARPRYYVFNDDLEDRLTFKENTTAVISYMTMSKMEKDDEKDDEKDYYGCRVYGYPTESVSIKVAPRINRK